VPARYEVIALEGLPEIRRGEELAPLIVEAARRQDTPIQDRDLLVVSQKIVSKTEGRVVRPGRRLRLGRGPDGRGRDRARPAAWSR